MEQIRDPKLPHTPKAAPKATHTKHTHDNKSSMDINATLASRFASNTTSGDRSPSRGCPPSTTANARSCGKIDTAYLRRYKEFSSELGNT